MRVFDYDRASELMDECGLDVIVTHTKHSGSYLADYWYDLYYGDPSFPLLNHPWQDCYQWAATFVGLPKNQDQEAFIVGWTDEANDIPAMDVWIQDRRYWGIEMIVTGETAKGGLYRGPLEATAAALSDRHLEGSAIGVEMRLLPMPFYQALKKLLPKATFRDAEPCLQRLRMIKTPEEIRRLRLAAGVLDTAMGAFYKSVREGMRDTDLVTKLKLATLDAGGEFVSCHMAVGPNGAKNIRPTGEQVAAGKIVRVDLIVSYERYLADFSRVRSFGPPSTETRRVHEVILKANERMRSMVAPGVRCADVYEVGINEIQEGQLTSLNAFLGHSLGCELVHEYPFIMPTDTTVLAPGMVIAVEPALRYKGVGSVNIEDMVLVTSDGNEELTHYDRGLAPIG